MWIIKHSLEALKCKGYELILILYCPVIWTKDEELDGSVMNHPLRFCPFVQQSFSLTRFDLLVEQRANYVRAASK